MLSLFSLFLLAVVALWSSVLPIIAQVIVTQEHNHLSRDGLYIDSAVTPSAAAGVTRDLNFNGTILGNVYAQPLYIENGPGGALPSLRRNGSQRRSPWIYDTARESRRVCRVARAER